jgi:hypothetical protein
VKSPRFSLTSPLSQEREKSSRPVFTMCGEPWDYCTIFKQCFRQNWFQFVTDILNIEHQTLYGSHFRNMGAPFMWILKKKYDYWWKKCGLEKTDRATKTSLFDRNWAISLKPMWRSRPARSFLWKVGEHAVVGKETLKFGSIFGSLPDFPSLRP